MRLPALAYLREFSIRLPKTWFMASGSAITSASGAPANSSFDPRVHDDPAQGLDGILDQGAGARRLQRELVIGALDAGQRQQVLGQPVHARGVLQDHTEKLEGGFGAWIGVLDQRLNVPLNGSERGAQLMAHVGDELAAGFFAQLRRRSRRGERRARRRWAAGRH